ncbi:hypothetical protein CD149_09080 [Staphylococcus condimenti]|uniref:Sporulation protein n=1 Tax=Staphylococcus condimenti TaxID=70255 RepID=A0AB37GYD8_9STAP|nr:MULTISPECIES: sporulation protein [Staphylococcus]AMY06248.1 hypothetical protein A4G25_10055 [Staphylococcus condimenti]APR60129.1 hypothetical protein BTZ13_02465 [Staphylococcus condimenti]MDK8645163.1 sporulation protein [Staphylococcus condimenti]OFO99553.1 hypothetical protein HMPREF3007_12050 [Staphylococcus sp. HMSC065E08]PNZ59216.1 hypothetical protein CD149_09080 [Staphylococcus condimenti]
MLDKILTSIKVGELTVDTRLEKADFKADETVSGKVILKGGNEDEEVSRIRLTLLEPKEGSSENTDFGESDKVLQMYEIKSEQVVEKAQSVEKPFEFRLANFDLDKTTNALVLRTHITIGDGKDSEDEEEIRIQ